MSELELLIERKRAVGLSAQLQRKAIVARLDRIERHPLRTALGFSKDLMGALPMKQLLIAAFGLGLRHFARRG
jgi:hypothetical protein